MRFKVDENLPVQFAALLRAANHDAETVNSQRLQGEPDSLIVEVCRREQRILVTLDLDFANVHAYPPDQHPGFIVLRPHRQDINHLIGMFRQTIPLLEREPIEHRLWIVEETRVRIRGEQPGMQSQM
jgi:predicted nuclease of predicted toxin-antitoxin system